jgi:hypothetical protein
VNHFPNSVFRCKIERNARVISYYRRSDKLSAHSVLVFCFTCLTVVRVSIVSISLHVCFVTELIKKRSSSFVVEQGARDVEANAQCLTKSLLSKLLTRRAHIQRHLVQVKLIVECIPTVPPTSKQNPLTNPTSTTSHALEINRGFLEAHNLRNSTNW